MTSEPQPRALTLVVCGAGPAAAISTMIELAQQRGWMVQVIATPAAVEFFGLPAAGSLAGAPVRSAYRDPGAPRSRPAEAVIVAPATFNTICKWAHGISDTYALGILAEATGLAIPTVVLPFVNSALAGRAPFRNSVGVLRAEGVRVLLGPGGIQPHPPRTGDTLIESYPWHLALDEAERITHDPAGQ
jgi:phosphopantothenoylcysteine synthetase/decarboxylase